MHEYLDSAIVQLMLKIKPDCSQPDLYVAAKMMEMCGIEPIPGGGSLAGRSLVLGAGLSPFANALGDKTFGHEVIGICFHASSIHQQNWWKSRSRSRARFMFSTPKDLLLAMPVTTWQFVFVLPYVNWNEISDFVLNRMQDSKIVVAQKMPAEIEFENLEPIFIRTTMRGYCHPATEEDGEWVIFQVR